MPITFCDLKDQDLNFQLGIKNTVSSVFLFGYYTGDQNYGYTFGSLQRNVHFFLPWVNCLGLLRSIWALSGTALSQVEHCLGQRWVKLSIVKESAESSWAWFRTALSHVEHCQFSIYSFVTVKLLFSLYTTLVKWY